MRNKNRRIAVFSINDRRGGAENILKLTALYFKSLGYKVDIIVLRRTDSKFWSTDGFDVKPFWAFFITAIFLRTRFAYTFSSHLKMNACIGILRKFRFLNTQYSVARESTKIFSRYSGVKLFYLKTLYIIGYRTLNLIICQNDIMRFELLRNVPILESIKSCVIRNPLDIAQIVKRSNMDCDVCDVNESFVAVGRLIPEKGFDNLLRAFAISKTILPKLYIIGEGPEEENLNKIIEEYDLATKVILLGYRDNPYPFMKNAFGCVLSSRVEGFPNVLNEMILLNPNVLSSFCVPEVESLGFILKEEIEDIVKFSEALEELGSDLSSSSGRLNYIESLRPEHFFNSLKSNLH